MDGRSQTGLVCASSIDDYNKGIIKKHEFTRPEKEQDRINHITATRAQTGNVFLAYNDVPELNALISHWQEHNAPVYDFIADDGITHTIWVVADDAAVNEITERFATQVPATYIADGHHRAASAALVQKAGGTDVTADQPINFFLTTIFPASQLAILDYNRVVKDLNGHSKEDFISRLEYDFLVEPIGHHAQKPSMLHEFAMYLDHTCTTSWPGKAPTPRTPSACWMSPSSRTTCWTNIWASRIPVQTSASTSWAVSAGSENWLNG